MELIERNIINNDWVTLIFLFLFSLIALSNFLYAEKFYSFRQLFVSNRYFTTQQGNFQVFNKFTTILFVVSTTIISLGIFLLAEKLEMVQTNTTRFIFFLRIFILVNLLISIKYFIEKIIANIFDTDKVIDQYLFHKITYKNLITICFLPILILFFYTFNVNLTTIIVAISVYAFVNIYILIKHYTKNQEIVFRYWFHFILYLCTLEIAPYVILYKIITVQN
ncbi:DUF4271 domain-containing protein [Mesonia sp. K7]|uniref:DUF4271 domain-containing protein n=1 Tax=Mesonia sp. K7 TaxID=2218606 RepID=UPI000DAA1259|nr:DUF4271 domain-containing protein [Mesonia sp. K7]PZD77740.1 hypothetical protein DNG35_07845 [Mesonia sp. K7]